MNILLATDSFPPNCGGSGWSTYELATGLRGQGHTIVIVQPRPGTDPGLREREYEGFRVIELGTSAPDLPYVRNYFKNERLYPVLRDVLSDVIRREAIDLIHGQHVLTCLPSIAAAERAGIPSVCTVRDYWPVCYWSDLLYTRSGTTTCPECSAAMMTRCIRPRGGLLWPVALPLIPYMRANLARKRTGLAAADAIIAVSSVIAGDLRARAPELSASRIDVIPNPTNIAVLRASAAATTRPIPGPYALYLGKLAPNKGTSALVDVVERANLDWPLAVVGDGPDRAPLEAAARASSRDIRFVGWLDRRKTIEWLAHASLLVFPSRGPESLSRVLIEASALGVPIAAMKTGGTGDIVVPEETGLLSNSATGLAADVKRLRDDEELRQRLGTGARLRAEQLFDATPVVRRVEALYQELVSRR